MAKDSTLQIRMDSELKAQAEALYRSLGTSFAEAVRIFAQQSLREGGMPFRPTLRTWGELSDQEVSKKLSQSEADMESGRVCTQEELDERMKMRFSRGQ